MKKVSIKYAIACSALLGVTFVISFYLGFNPFVELSHMFLDVVMFGLMIFFAVSEYRRTEGEGYLHFWQGMSIGFLVYGVAIGLYMILLVVFMLVEGNVLIDYKTQAMAYLLEQSEMYIEQFGEAQFQGQKDAIEETTISSLIMSGAIKKIVTGLFVTPVISIFLRKKPI